MKQKNSHCSELHLIMTAFKGIKWQQILKLVLSVPTHFKCYHINYYEGESKVLQYFGNVRHNTTALDGSAKVVKMMNRIGL